MNASQYRQQVLALESKPDQVNVNPFALSAAITIGVDAGNILDKFKRAIFYGKPVEAEAMKPLVLRLVIALEALLEMLHHDAVGPDSSSEIFADARRYFPNASCDNVDIRMLHCAIGGFTEKAELIDAVAQSIMTAAPIDVTNLIEELGDAAFYDEIGLDALGITRDARDAANMKKLLDKKNGRYKSGTFSADAALNRDVQAERALLEGEARA